MCYYCRYGFCYRSKWFSGMEPKVLIRRRVNLIFNDTRRETGCVTVLIKHNITSDSMKKK